MPPNSKILLKKRGKYLQKEGGLGQNPPKRCKNRNNPTGKLQNNLKYRLGESIIR